MSKKMLISSPYNYITFFLKNKVKFSKKAKNLGLNEVFYVSNDFIYTIPKLFI